MCVSLGDKVEDVVSGNHYRVKACNGFDVKLVGTDNDDVRWMTLDTFPSGFEVEEEGDGREL